MSPTESMHKFLRELGCKKRGEYFILDGIGNEFYLLFDASDNPETPDLWGTVDIYLARIGASPNESCERLRAVADCRRHQVMRFMFALGVEIFSEATRKALYDANKIVRTA